MFVLRLSLEVGRVDPDAADHDAPMPLDAYVETGPDPERRPIGFAPASDPTRHPDDE